MFVKVDGQTTVYESKTGNRPAYRFRKFVPLQLPVEAFPITKSENEELNTGVIIAELLSATLDCKATDIETIRASFAFLNKLIAISGYFLVHPENAAALETLSGVFFSDKLYQSFWKYSKTTVSLLIFFIYWILRQRYLPEKIAQFTSAMYLFLVFTFFQERYWWWFVHCCSCNKLH